MASWTVYLLTSVLALILYRIFRKNKYKLPPGKLKFHLHTKQSTNVFFLAGPFAWPIIGNGKDLQPFFYTATTKWAKQYGDICTFYFGKYRWAEWLFVVIVTWELSIVLTTVVHLYRTVILSDVKLVREAFNDPLLSGRHDDEMFTLTSDGQHGQSFLTIMYKINSAMDYMVPRKCQNE